MLSAMWTSFLTVAQPRHHNHGYAGHWNLVIHLRGYDGRGDGPAEGPPVQRRMGGRAAGAANGPGARGLHCGWPDGSVRV